MIGFENLELEKNKCSLDNNQRLDKIVNLHDLVNFKVKTVADKYFDYLKEPVKDNEQQEQNRSFSILQQMYDPLLQISSFNQRSKVKNFINQKQKSLQNIKIKKQNSDYQIPEELQKKQKNYNILNDVQQKELQSLPQQNTLKTSFDESSIDKDQIQNYHNLIKINTNMDLKSEIQNQISQQSQEEKISIDPIQQLKNFFLYKKQEKKNQKDSGKKSNKKQTISQDEKQEINLMDYSDQLNQDQGLNQQQIQKKDYKLKAVHENYIISKYQKMRKSGQLDKQMKLQSEELQNLENIQIQITQNQIHKIYQEVLKKNSNIEDEIINYPIKKKLKTGPNQTSQQFHRPVKVINKPKSMQYNRKNVHNIEVPAIMKDFNQQYEAEDPQNIQTQSHQTQFRDHKNQYSNQEQKSIETFQNAHRILKDVLNESRDEGTAQAISLKHSQESPLSYRNNQISNSFNKNPFLLEDNQASIIYSQVFDKNINQEKNKSSQDEILFENIRKHRTLIEDIIGQRSSSQMMTNKDDEYGLRQENQKNEHAKEKQNQLNGYSFKYNNEFAKNQELKIKKNQMSSQEYSDSKTNKLNIHGSLPNLRMQLESKKTSKPLTSKIYQEDKHEVFNAEQQYELGDIQQIQIIDLSMLDLLQRSQDGLNVESLNLVQNQDMVQDFRLIQNPQTQNFKSKKSKLKESISSQENYHDPFRVVGIRLQQANKNLNGIKKQVNFGKIKKAIQSFDQASSPIKSIDSFKKSTLLMQKNLNIQMVETGLQNKDIYEVNYEEKFSQQNLKLYKDQCEQINEYDNQSLQQKDEKPTFKLIEKSDQNYTKKTPKPNSITKSSRISIFSNQQNRSFGNQNNQMARNFANSQTLSKEYKYGQTTQAKSENNQAEKEETQQIEEQQTQIKDNIELNQIQKNQSMHMTQQRIFDDMDLINSSSIKEGSKQGAIINKASAESEKSQNSIHLSNLKGNLLNQTANIDMISAKKVRIQIESINQKSVSFQDKNQLQDQKMQPHQAFQLTDSKLPDKLHMIKTDLNSIISNQEKSFVQQAALNQKTFIQIENTKPQYIQPYYDIRENSKSNIRKFSSKQVKQLKISTYQNQISQDIKFQNELKNKKRTGSDERGYQSSNEPFMDQISTEIYDQVLSDFIKKKGYWIPSRFKIFPRFQNNHRKNKISLDDLNINQKYISLNKNVLAFLASIDLKNAKQNLIRYNDPAILNKSSIKVRRMKNYQSGQNKNHLISHLNDKNDTEETINLEQSIGEYTDRAKLRQIDPGSHKINRSENKDLSIFQEQAGNLHLQVQIQNLNQSNDYVEDISQLTNNFSNQQQHFRNSNFDKKSLETNLNGSNQNSSVNVLDQLLYNDNGKQQIIDSIQEEQTQQSERKQNVKQRRKDNFQIIEESIVSEEIHKSLPQLKNHQNYENFLLIKHFDPFDKVYLSQRMENQILTSKRTLQKSNNIISNTLKVLHKRFQPKQMPRYRMKKFQRGNQLYPISINLLQNIAQDIVIQQELSKMNEEQRTQFIHNLEQINIISEYYDIQEIAAMHFKEQNSFNDPQNVYSNQQINRENKNSLLSNSESNLMEENNPHLNSKITDPIISNTNIVINQNLNVESPINDKYQSSNFTKIMIQKRKAGDRKNSSGKKSKSEILQNYKINNQQIEENNVQDMQLLNADSNKFINEQTLSARNNSKNEDSQVQINQTDQTKNQINEINQQIKISPNTSKQKFHQKQKRQNLSLPRYDISTGQVSRADLNPQNDTSGLQNITKQITQDILRKQENSNEIKTNNQNFVKEYQNNPIKIVDRSKFKSLNLQTNKNSMRDLNDYQNKNIKILEDYNNDSLSQGNHYNQINIQSAKQASEYLEAQIQHQDQSLKKQEIKNVKIINKESKNSSTNQSFEQNKNFQIIKIPQLSQKQAQNSYGQNVKPQGQSRQQPTGLYVPILNFQPPFQSLYKNQAKTVENNDVVTQSHRTNSKQPIQSNVQSQSNLSNNLVKLYGDSESNYKLENKKSYENFQNIYGSLPNSQQQKQRLKKSFKHFLQSSEKREEDTKQKRYVNFNMAKKSVGVESQERMNILIKKKTNINQNQIFNKKEDSENQSSKDSRSNKNMRVTQETFHIKDDTTKNINCNNQVISEDFEQIIRQNSLLEKSNSKKQFSINLLEYETNFKSNNESKNEMKEQFNLYEKLDEKKILIENKNQKQDLNLQQDSIVSEIPLKKFPKASMKQVCQKKSKIENVIKEKSQKKEEDAYNLLYQVIQKTNNQNLTEISEVLVSLANNSTIKNTLATLSVSNTISKEDVTFPKNSPIKTFIQTNTENASIEQKKKNVQYLQQLLQNLNLTNERKYQVKKMIDDLYTQNNQYQKKPTNNYVSSKGFIFDSVKMNRKSSALN